MHCFNHSSTPAVGVCKACQKGLCAECAVDVGGGIACKDSCETYVAELNEMNERNLKIYGIGKYKTRMPSSGVLLWGVLSILLWAVVGYVYYRTGSPNYEVAVPAVFFTIITAFAFYSSRRTGINC
jgi:hypothetical protein